MSRFNDYTKNTDFTAWQTANPGEPHSGANLDGEYDEIATIIGEVQDNAQLIQREDGAVANGVVTPDSLSQGALNLIGGGWAPEGEWVTATSYVVSDVVSNSGTTYVCNTAHTSAAAFATDNAAGYWTVIAGQASLFAKAAGTADALTVTIEGLPTTIDDGTEIKVRALLANTGAATIAVNTLAPVAIKRIGGVALQAGNIRAEDHDLGLRYNAGNDWWELKNPAHHLDQVAPVADKINYYDGAAANAQLSVGAYGQTAIAWDTVAEARTSLGVASAGAQHSLTELLNPEVDAGWADVYRGGWEPAWMNQQWGGAQWGGLTDGSAGDVATCSLISGQVARGIANAAARTYQAQGFKVSAAVDCAAVWVMMRKSGNPSNNLELYIYDDSAGDPDSLITNGTATAQSGMLHSTEHGFVRFVFPTAPSLSADTQYHIVMKSSGAVDAANFWQLSCEDGQSYPHGELSEGDATPAWTPTGDTAAFIVEHAAASRMLLTGGQFDAYIDMSEGAPLNQSRGLIKPLSDFMDGGVGTLLIRGEDYTKDKTIADLTLGALDHDRIVLRCSVTTGYAQVEIYESDGTVHTVAGATTDLSDGSFHDVAVRWRSKADGSDYLSLYVDGAEEGAPIASAIITLAAALERQGYCWMGGGFPPAVTWDEDEDMSALPSAGNWTWTGTGTEANAMVVSGGQLYQNGAGYSSAHSGYYSITPTLSNANGWTIQTSLQVKNSTNLQGNGEIVLKVQDGAKTVTLYFQEYFIEVNDGSVIGYIQQDMTDRAHEILIIGKLADFFVFVDGRLMFDGTGLLDAASATNQIDFGDISTTAGDNGTAVWDYMKYYDAAWLPPEHCGGKISQVAHWAVDQTSLIEELWGSGTQQSVKELAGVKENYIKTASRNLRALAIVSAPTSTATSYELIDDMYRFVIASERIDAHSRVSLSNSGTNTMNVAMHLDGALMRSEARTQNDANHEAMISLYDFIPVSAGMHIVEAKHFTAGGTTTFNLEYRQINVEGK